jgi:23S rRNA (pseudouridine1915-N3)-methyltransferase
MKIECWSIGKQHDSYVREGIELFTKRIAHYYPIQWKIVPNLKNAAAFSPDQLREREGEIILNTLKKDQTLFLLDEKGKIISSPALGTKMLKQAEMGTSSLVFLIGGAFGVSEAVFQKASFVWSISELVFPHHLVRLILAEQIYRACSINNNEKYHHS